MELSKVSALNVIISEVKLNLKEISSSKHIAKETTASIFCKSSIFKKLHLNLFFTGQAVVVNEDLLASIITLNSMLIADFTRNHLARVPRKELSIEARTEKKIAK